MQQAVAISIVASLFTMTLAGCTASVTTAGGTTGGQSGSGTNPSASASPNLKKVKQVTINTPGQVVLIGKTTKLQATVQYEDGSVDSNVTWSSDDTTVVNINATNGEISGITGAENKTATVRASATVDSTKLALTQVSVKAASTSDLLVKITPDAALTLKVGSTAQLSATVTKSDGTTGGNVQWSSTSTSVAAVNNGLVTGVGAGTAEIVATADNNPNVKASVKVTVTT